jgi:hypothetical protein
VERLGLQTDNDEARARAFLLKAEILIDGGRLQEASECAARGHALAKRIHHIQLMNALSALVE